MAITRLLLVEDDEDDFIITRDLLHDINPDGYQVVWARSPEEAHKHFYSSDFEVCLLDYSLGAFTGLQILAEAQRQGFDAPIIMLTGHDDSALDAEALSAGAVDYLVKSQLTAARLSRAIRYAVARRDMEQERLERLKAEAENKSKSEFLAHLSHELRTPLTSILGYTDLLLQNQPEQPQLDHLSIIKRNGYHLLSLLNDVLDLSKIEAGRLEIQFSELALPSFLTELYQLITIKAEDKGIRFRIEALTELPSQIITDATRLRQILLNFLSNAVKFTDEGEVRLDIFATRLENSCRLSFRVIDTGIGISPSEQKKLFTPFVQAKGDRYRSELGSGLGLAISQQLAHLLGGEISLQSEIGAGSCFTLTLECKHSTEYHYQTWDLQQPTASIHFESPCLSGQVLVVDDVREIRELVAHLLEGAGCNVQQAANGREAINLLQMAHDNDKPFDLVVMDVQMPVMDGLTATQELRKLGFEIPVIALTAQTMLGERQRCLDAGCSEHLGKPVQPDQLFDLLAKYLPDSIVDKKLILIEDDEDARSATQQLLSALGWEAKACGDGESALQLFETYQPSLILMDINLPDMDGFTLAKKIRDKAYTGRLLAATGESPSSDKLTESGFDGVLSKPYDLSKLAQL
ncbi:hybrid sensor histidine kinase/response regulator [Microbulbifer sp. THAF38]|uniref:hybrid sensor histidine kinase/response regulator n=1 Tax=Microbulbifer sp. THAF38 TaxID=2587856 RepID=UPI001269837E|nr:hybrid sensor histidine kinase/response regulator [Microbulbifer sp. THAF38]QFT55993.1 Aerobic respiration control sensor protein ArcB [Microbulbifer sp. THAF38]